MYIKLIWGDKAMGAVMKAAPSSLSVILQLTLDCYRIEK
jgi:hypothetical protein